MDAPVTAAVDSKQASKHLALHLPVLHMPAPSLCSTGGVWVLQARPSFPVCILKCTRAPRSLQAKVGLEAQLEQAQQDKTGLMTQLLAARQDRNEAVPQREESASNEAAATATAIRLQGQLATAHKVRVRVRHAGGLAVPGGVGCTMRQCSAVQCSAVQCC